ASARWDETESLHFTLEAEGDTFLDSDRTIRLVSAEGDLARPASVEATARVSVAVTSVNVNLIVIEDDAYMTNLISGDWEEAPDDFSYNPALLFDDEDGLGPIMQDIENPQLSGSESVDGRDAHRVTGIVTEDQIRDITAGSITGEQIDVTLWIAADNADVVRLLLTSPGEGDAADTTWNLNFTDHNQDVTIEPPI
ncbi:MAG TPA: LppX_LprAFG lipoprotein, partial [Thermomicrobiales bacterium]|nr:LppX_LprAFG lipoprotein [Thermomicrobiales bacterium]